MSKLAEDFKGTQHEEMAKGYIEFATRHKVMHVYWPCPNQGLQEPAVLAIQSNSTTQSFPTLWKDPGPVIYDEMDCLKT